MEMIDRNPLANDDILRVVADLVGGREEDHLWFSRASPPKGTACHIYFRPVSKPFSAAWGMRSPLTAITASTTATQLLSCVENGLPMYIAGRYCAKLGSVHLLRVLQSRGYQLTSTTCEAAAEGGHKDVLLWLRRNGCTWAFSG